MRKVFRFFKTFPAAMIANTSNADNMLNPGYHSSPSGQPYVSVSGDSKWSDLSIPFSQKITGEIKIKIEIIIRSI